MGGAPYHSVVLLEGFVKITDVAETEPQRAKKIFRSSCLSPPGSLLSK